MEKSHLAKKIKEYRTASKLTQEAVSKYLGMSRPAYALYESGKSTPPFNTLETLASLYKVTISEFLYEDDAMTEKEINLFDQVISQTLDHEIEWHEDHPFFDPETLTEYQRDQYFSFLEYHKKKKDFIDEYDIYIGFKKNLFFRLSSQKIHANDKEEKRFCFFIGKIDPEKPLLRRVNGIYYIHPVFRQKLKDLLHAILDKDKQDDVQLLDDLLSDLQGS